MSPSLFFTPVLLVWVWEGRTEPGITLPRVLESKNESKEEIVQKGALTNSSSGKGRSKD